MGQQPAVAIAVVYLQHTADAAQFVGGHGPVELHLQHLLLVGTAAHGARLVVGHHVAAVDDDHPVADGLHLLHDMGAEHHGLRPADVLDQRPHIGELVGVQAAGGLIEDQHLRVMDQGLRQAHPLAVALAQLPDALVLLAPQAHQLHHALGPRGPVAQPVHPRHEAQVLMHVQVQVQRVVLGQVAHVAAHVHAVRTGVEAAHGGRARSGRDEAGEHLHHGALARAVGAQEAHHFAGADLEGHRVQRLLRAVDLGDAADGNGHGAKVRGGRGGWLGGANASTDLADLTGRMRWDPENERCDRWIAFEGGIHRCKSVKSVDRIQHSIGADRLSTEYSHPPITQITPIGRGGSMPSSLGHSIGAIGEIGGPHSAFHRCKSVIHRIRSSTDHTDHTDWSGW